MGSEPSAPNAEPNDPAAAEPLAAPPEPHVGDPGAPPPAPGASAASAADPFAATPWLRPGDGPVLQTELQDLNVCKSCNTPVPVGATQCPKCKKFTLYNTGRKSRKGDVEKILDNLLREYEPATTVLKETCEHLARAYGELKTMPAGSLEWQRILNITQELSVSLEASRPRPAADEDYANMPEPEMVARTTRLLSMLFIARDEPGQDAMLRDLLHLFLRPWASHRQREMRRNIRAFCDEHERGLPPDPESPVISFEPSTSRDAGPSVQVAAPIASKGVAPTLAPAPEPCKWCNRHPCIGDQHEMYYVLHPEAAQQREDKRLNEEMWMQLGKPARWDV